MNKIFKKLAPFILLAGFVLFLVLGINNVKAQNSYVETTAVITRIEVEEAIDPEESNDYTVYVEYTADGKDYEGTLDKYDVSMSEGEEVTVKYNPENPGEIVAAGASNYIITFAVSALCLVSAVIAFFKFFL